MTDSEAVTKRATGGSGLAAARSLSGRDNSAAPSPEDDSEPTPRAAGGSASETPEHSSPALVEPAASALLATLPHFDAGWVPEGCIARMTWQNSSSYGVLSEDLHIDSPTLGSALNALPKGTVLELLALAGPPPGARLRQDSPTKGVTPGPGKVGALVPPGQGERERGGGSFGPWRNGLFLL